MRDYSTDYLIKFVINYTETSIRPPKPKEETRDQTKLVASESNRPGIKVLRCPNRDQSRIALAHPT